MQDLKDSGYDGRPITVLDPTDSPYAHGPALVTAELLKKIGANPDLQAMDWSTLVSRRAKKEPPAQGGWNLFHTWATSFDAMTPAVASVLGGAGEKSWFGWPTSEQMEKLRTAFVRETDPVKRKQIADQAQILNFDEVLFVSWGQFVVPGAFRKNVQGVLQFGATLLWNVSV
jgi:peptide/nickel transport system substrate-binding protein